jgi:hypothetical protein
LALPNLGLSRENTLLCTAELESHSNAQKTLLAIFTEKSTSWEVSHTITLGHNIINNFRFGRLEAIANQGGNPAPVSAVTAMNIAGVFQNIPGAYRF